MAALASTVLLILSLNLLFFTLVTSCNTCEPAPRTPVPKHPPTVTPPKTNPSPKIPVPSTKRPVSCPRDTLKLAACADVLNGVVHLVIGTPVNTRCCSLINGLVDLDAAVCLCTALRARVLGINLDLDVALTLLLNTCDKRVPAGFRCA